MLAQQFQILANPEGESPWYPPRPGQPSVTPEWTFPPGLAPPLRDPPMRGRGPFAD